MTAAADRVAVVIVNYNAGLELARVMAGLAEQSRHPDRVVVVDNGSSDGSLERIDGLLEGVEIIRPDTNLGFAGGNNLGVSLVGDCSWVALLNPDAVPEPDWLNQLMEAVEREPECPMFASCLLVDGEDDLLDGTGDDYFRSGLALRRDHGATLASGSRDDSAFSPCGAAALFSRDAFVAAGGFCERFFCYLEDVDLAFRLRLTGGWCRYVPTSRVRHVGSATAGRESDFTIYHSHRNLVWTFVGNMPRGLLLAALPQHIALNLTSIVWFSIRGHARPILRAKRDALMGLPWALRRRREIQAERTASDAAIRRVFSRSDSGWRRAVRRALNSVRGSAAGRMR